MEAIAGEHFSPPQKYKRICGCGGIGKRCERRRWRMKRAERVAAVGEGRRLFKAEDIRRAPQQEDALDFCVVTLEKGFSLCRWQR